MTVGEKIRTLRKQAKLTQTELGEKLGVKKNAVSKWECGRVEDIPASKIKAMAFLFDVSPSYLIDDETTLDPAEQIITDDQIKFALFGTTDVDDDVLEDVKALARTAAEQAAKRKKKG